MASAEGTPPFLLPFVLRPEGPEDTGLEDTCGEGPVR